MLRSRRGDGQLRQPARERDGGSDRAGGRRLRRGRREGDRAGEAANVEIERISFPARQRIGERSSLTMTVRNAGDAQIRDLVVVLRGFSSATDQKPQRPLWLVDEPPAGSGTSLADSYATGPLASGRRRTLRWHVTAVLPGAHAVSYSVGRRARGTLRVRVTAKPPFARVDPRTGRVVRELSPPNG